MKRFPFRLLPVFPLVVILLLSGCVGDHDWPLAEDDRQWIPYTDQQLVVFQNDAGATDTLRVVLRTGKRPHEKNDKYFTEYMQGEAKSKSGTGIYIQFDLVRYYLTVGGGIPVQSSAKFGAAYSISQDKLEAFNANSQFLKNFTSRSRTYPEVISVSRSFPSQTDNLQAFIFAKTAGVIRFEAKDGVKWYLKN